MVHPPLRRLAWLALAAAVLSGCSRGSAAQPPSPIAIWMGARAVELPPGAVAVFGVDIARRIGPESPVLLSVDAPAAAPLSAEIEPFGSGGVLTVTVRHDAPPGSWDAVVHAQSGGRTVASLLRVVVVGRKTPPGRTEAEPGPDPSAADAGPRWE